MGREYILYADESVAVGEYYSNFYGGALVKASDLSTVNAALKAKKAALNLHREVKWQRVTGNYLSKYTDLISSFFDEVSARRVKVRLMFSQNAHVPTGANAQDSDQRYFKLYYQFV